MQPTTANVDPNASHSARLNRKSGLPDVRELVEWGVPQNGQIGSARLMWHEQAVQTS